MVLYNRDAKYLSYDRNRRVFLDQHDGYIHGKFMIAKFVKGHYASLTNEEIEFAKKEFEYF